MARINAHIHYNGNAEDAFTFYKTAFGGAFTKIIRFRDLNNPDYPIPENERNKIMLIAIRIGNNNDVLTGSDVPASMGQVNENENRFKISISAESKEEADKLFNSLSVGGQVEMPIMNSPWGTYFGMFRDKFGIEWMVEYNGN
jgi:PhnB protein